MIICYIYDSASNFEDGYAVVSYNGKSGIIDRGKNFIIEAKSAETELSFLPIIAITAVLFSSCLFWYIV